MAGALEGVRVVEIANYVSGPYAGVPLGDMGADIINVEKSLNGDPLRGWGRVDSSHSYGSVKHDNKSVMLDLKSDLGKSDARALVLCADVVIEKFRGGAMERERRL